MKNCWLFVDKDKFATVLRNLVSRAISVSNSGQSIDIYFFLRDVVEAVNPSNSLRTQRRGTVSNRSNRIAIDDRTQYETEFERQLREEDEREIERERQLQASCNSKQILRIEIYDSGPTLNEVNNNNNNNLIHNNNNNN